MRGFVSMGAVLGPVVVGLAFAVLCCFIADLEGAALGVTSAPLELDAEPPKNDSISRANAGIKLFVCVTGVAIIISVFVEAEAALHVIVIPLASIGINLVATRQAECTRVAKGYSTNTGGLQI